MSPADLVRSLLDLWLFKQSGAITNIWVFVFTEGSVTHFDEKKVCRTNLIKGMIGLQL